MAVAMKHQWQLGDSGWEVEWCESIPLDENGDALMDELPMQCRNFLDKESAIKFAKKIYPKDAFGSVRITPFTIEPLSDTWPYGRHMEYTADSEHYEGE